MRRIDLYLWALIFALLLGAQSIQLPPAAGSLGLGVTSMGATLPAHCSVGYLFFLTSATHGQNLYGCTATNVWTLESGGGGGTGPAGPTGATGPAGASFQYADSETPAGTIDGNNAVFTLAAAPYPADSLQLASNGLLLDEGSDYTLSGNSITFAEVPQPGDLLLAWYRHL